MTYVSQVVEHQGMPYIEYRSEPDIIPQDKIEISFEPTFPYSNYAYTEPTLTFGQRVALAREWNYCSENGLDFEDSYYYYRISALELKEDVSKSGNCLIEQPYWMYGMRGTDGTNKLIWFHEHELVDPFNTGGDEEF